MVPAGQVSLTGVSVRVITVAVKFAIVRGPGFDTVFAVYTVSPIKCPSVIKLPGTVPDAVKVLPVAAKVNILVVAADVDVGVVSATIGSLTVRAVAVKVFMVF